MARRQSVLVAPAIVHAASYANNLTGLIPDLYTALDVVSRELVGYVPSVNRDTGVERAALGQSVTYQVSPAVEAHDIAPAMNTPEPSDHNIGNGTMAITKSRGVNFGMTGEEQRGLNTGPGYVSVQAGLIAQSLRTLTNEIERDLAQTTFRAASRGFGEAGVTPFAENLKDTAQVRKILDDNGAPPGDRSLVLNTSAGAGMRTLANLTKVNEAGDAMTLRQGELLDLHGFSVKESAASIDHVGGDAADAQTDGSAHAVGTTTIRLGAVGTGGIVRGDVIYFAGDPNGYVVVQGVEDASTGGTVRIASPGLRRPLTGEAVAVTVAGAYSANTAFSASAVHLATRAPALPQEGDAALDRQTITDPRSGLSFEVSLYAGYRKIMGEVAIAWGTHASKSEHIALLLG